jgi:ethanolamine ammonia-lyase small subunit
MNFMVTEQELRKAVESILMEMGGRTVQSPAGSGHSGQTGSTGVSQDGILPDLAAVDLRSVINVPNPHNLEALRTLKQSTPARVGVWRAGPRYLTETLLRFRADHAAAMDAVFTDVSEEWIKQNNLPHFKTQCDSKDTYLTRPDLGRLFDAGELQKIKTHVGGNNRVVIYIADGLSTTAVTTNAIDTFKAIRDGLQRHDIKPAAPFFVQYGRVGAEDAISEATGAEVIVTLIGERPGLITAESMSAYMAYKATMNMPEARRTVVSNIHKGGTPAVEAGGYIADIIKKMLDNKASGLDLKL